jgi:hypothetical protein
MVDAIGTEQNWVRLKMTVRLVEEAPSTNSQAPNGLASPFLKLEV